MMPQNNLGQGQILTACMVWVRRWAAWCGPTPRATWEKWLPSRDRRWKMMLGLSYAKIHSQRFLTTQRKRVSHVSPPCDFKVSKRECAHWYAMIEWYWKILKDIDWLFFTLYHSIIFDPLWIPVTLPWLPWLPCPLRRGWICLLLLQWRVRKVPGIWTVSKVLRVLSFKAVHLLEPVNII